MDNKEAVRGDAPTPSLSVQKRKHIMEHGSMKGFEPKAVVCDVCGSTDPKVRLCHSCGKSSCRYDVCPNDNFHEEELKVRGDAPMPERPWTKQEREWVDNWELRHGSAGLQPYRFARDWESFKKQQES